VAAPKPSQQKPLGTSHSELVEQINKKWPAIEHTEEWFEGFDDFKRGVTKMRNPYSRGSERYDQWQDGWETAFYGEPRE